MNLPLDLAPGGMDVFVPYGGRHALAVAVCVLLIAAPTPCSLVHCLGTPK